VLAAAFAGFNVFRTTEDWPVSGILAASFLLKMVVFFSKLTQLGGKQ
jgi:hypothetical protein